MKFLDASGLLQVLNSVLTRIRASGCGCGGAKVYKPGVLSPVGIVDSADRTNLHINARFSDAFSLAEGTAATYKITALNAVSQTGLTAQDSAGRTKRPQEGRFEMPALTDKASALLGAWQDGEWVSKE